MRDTFVKDPLRQRIREMASLRVRYGYRRVPTVLRREGWHIYVKRVYRLSRLDRFSLRLTARKKQISAPRAVPISPHKLPSWQWSIDFMSDSV